MAPTFWSWSKKMESSLLLAGEVRGKGMKAGAGVMGATIRCGVIGVGCMTGSVRFYKFQRVEASEDVGEVLTTHRKSTGHIQVHASCD